MTSPEPALAKSTNGRVLERTSESQNVEGLPPSSGLLCSQNEWWAVQSRWDKTKRFLLPDGSSRIPYIPP